MISLRSAKLDVPCWIQTDVPQGLAYPHEVISTVTRDGRGPRGGRPLRLAPVGIPWWNGPVAVVEYWRAARGFAVDLALDEKSPADRGALLTNGC
jgi:hypothetical protein